MDVPNDIGCLTKERLHTGNKVTRAHKQHKDGRIKITTVCIPNYTRHRYLQTPLYKSLTLWTKIQTDIASILKKVCI